MDPEEILNLFDSCWFNLEIFKNQPSFSSISSKFMKKTDESADQPKFSSLRSIILRSKSDELSSMSSFNYGSSISESPNSVLFNFSQQLQTILSGKESKVEPEKEEQLQQQQQQQQQQEQESEIKKSPLSEKDKEKPKKVRRRRTKIKGVTKSLSDLEFEELKGFMDLGFVFSEKDKDSSLVEIIPGLQRLGLDEKSDGSPNSKDQQEISSPVTKSESKSKSKSKSASRRPYLSEAWENLDRRKNLNLNLNLNPNPMLMNWRVPSLSNEVDVKDSLKLWAHNVASVVR